MTALKERIEHCYELSGRLALNDQKYTLVHGILTSPLTEQQLAHAWVEFESKDGIGMLVFDPVMDITLPQQGYYNLFKVTHRTVYLNSEAIENMTQPGHFGPWQKEKENGHG